jgi:hypothetical protein
VLKIWLFPYDRRGEPSSSVRGRLATIEGGRNYHKGKVFPPLFRLAVSG